MALILISILLFYGIVEYAYSFHELASLRLSVFVFLFVRVQLSIELSLYRLGV